MSKVKTVVNLIDELTETLKEKDEEIKELEDTIKKAIEYIEEKGRLKYKPEELLEILKGEDK